MPAVSQKLLVAGKQEKGQEQGPKKVKKNKKNRTKDDDAPRAFKRIMAVAGGQRIRSGLDDGSEGKPVQKVVPNPDLKIRPGEDMRSFSARVDASLPVSGLTKKTVIKDGKDEVGLKIYRTRKERKMHKLYDQWRAEDAKIKDSREEKQEIAEQEELDNEGSTAAIAAAELKDITSKKSKRKRGKAEDDDPWLELKKKRAEAKVALHEQAQAPPELNKNTSRQLKVGDAMADVANVPKASGSLRRREELQEVRADVVDAYRKIREHEQAKLNGKK